MNKFLNEKLNEKIVKIATDNGLSEVSATLLLWENMTQEEKKQLSFDNRVGLWQEADTNFEKEKAFEIIKDGAMEFNQWVELYNYAVAWGNYRKIFWSYTGKILGEIEARAETFGQCVCVWEINYGSVYYTRRKGPRSEKMLQQIIKKAKTFEQSLWALQTWVECIDRDPERTKAWNNVKKKAKTPWQKKRLWEETKMCSHKEREEVWTLLKNLAKTK